MKSEHAVGRAAVTRGGKLQNRQSQQQFLKMYIVWSLCVQMNMIFWGTFRTYFCEEALGLQRPDQFVDVSCTFQCGQGLFVGGRAADRLIRLQADADGLGGGASAD